MPVVFTMVRTLSSHFLLLFNSTVQLPELMLLRAMHDVGCDDIYIIVTDLTRTEMDAVTEYFKLVCRHAFGRVCKPSMERRIQHERMNITNTPTSLCLTVLFQICE